MEKVEGEFSKRFIGRDIAWVAREDVPAKGAFEGEDDYYRSLGRLKAFFGSKAGLGIDVEDELGTWDSVMEFLMGIAPEDRKTLYEEASLDQEGILSLERDIVRKKGKSFLESSLLK